MPNPMNCFNSFLNYVEEHKTAFDKHHREMIMEMIKDIAGVYHGTNKKEAALIKTLKSKMDEVFG